MICPICSGRVPYCGDDAWVCNHCGYWSCGLDESMEIIFLKKEKK